MNTILLTVLICQTPCELVAVHDGDTITVIVDGQTERIRLAGVDAPELRQAYGMEAKETLSTLLQGRKITLRFQGKKSYRRHVATVYADSINVNAELVWLGAAWQEPRYDRSVEFWSIECDARESKRGLWQAENPVEPRVWRHSR